VFIYRVCVTASRVREIVPAKRFRYDIKATDQGDLRRKLFTVHYDRDKGYDSWEVTSIHKRGAATEETPAYSGVDDDSAFSVEMHRTPEGYVLATYCAGLWATLARLQAEKSQ
jgi:hypothetical protein